MDDLPNTVDYEDVEFEAACLAPSALPGEKATYRRTYVFDKHFRVCGLKVGPLSTTSDRSLSLFKHHYKRRDNCAEVFLFHSDTNEPDSRGLSEMMESRLV